MVTTGSSTEKDLRFYQDRFRSLREEVFSTSVNDHWRLGRLETKAQELRTEVDQFIKQSRHRRGEELANAVRSNVPQAELESLKDEDFDWIGDEEELLDELDMIIDDLNT